MSTSTPNLAESASEPEDATPISIQVRTYRCLNDSHLPQPELMVVEVVEDPESTAACRMFRIEQEDDYIVLSMNGARQVLAAKQALHAQGCLS